MTRSDTSEEKVRGSVLEGYLGFIKKKWGQNGMDICLKETGCPYPLKGGVFYPEEDHINIIDWIDDNKGPEHVKDAGKFIIHNMGFLSYLVRFTNPHLLITRFPKSYRDAFNFGSISTEKTGPRSAIVRLHDVTKSEAACLGWQGVIEGALEVCKVKGQCEKTKCQHKGDDACEYIVTWIDRSWDRRHITTGPSRWQARTSLRTWARPRSLSFHRW